MKVGTKLGILAGGGKLPARIIEACRENDRPFFVIAFKGQADDATVAGTPHAWVRLGAAGKTLKLLRQAGVEVLVMAGRIRRPSLAALRPDAWAARFLVRSGAMALGDDGLLSAVIGELEANEGFRVIGPETLLPDILAAEGVYGDVEPDGQARRDIQRGIEAARDLGARDLGQGAVVRAGEVIAVEDAEGTDAMLERCRPGAGGVLVKVAKPGQESRVDLPTIGVSTVDMARAAGLAGIAVQAGRALVVDRAAVIERADEAGLFVVGVTVPEGR